MSGNNSSNESLAISTKVAALAIIPIIVVSLLAGVYLTSHSSSSSSSNSSKSLSTAATTSSSSFILSTFAPQSTICTRAAESSVFLSIFVSNGSADPPWTPLAGQNVSGSVTWAGPRATIINSSIANLVTPASGTVYLGSNFGNYSLMVSLSSIIFSFNFGGFCRAKNQHFSDRRSVSIRQSKYCELLFLQSE